jgi:hypothetical protein
MFSSGMDILAERIKDIPSIDNAIVYGYEEWLTVFDKLKKSSENTILIGHSFGALSTYKIVSVLPDRSFPLIVSFDYSPYYSNVVCQLPNGVVPSNVEYALNFYQKVDPIVRGVILTCPDRENDVKNVQSTKTHIEIDKDIELHDETVANIKLYM